MKTFLYTITEPKGMHARLAGLLSQVAKAYRSTVTLHSGVHSVDAAHLPEVLRLDIRRGDTLTVTAEGPDEAAAAHMVEQFFRARL